jgi:flagellar protein FliT
VETGHSNDSTTAASSRWASVVTAMEKVYDVTEELFQLVSQPIGKEHRDECILNITLLLEKRAQLLTEVQPPLAATETQRFQQMITWNEVIVKRFIEIKQQIQQDMIQLKKSKASNQQYINPYQNVASQDGMFYDKRK